MAVKKPICNYSGENKELQEGDTLPSELLSVNVIYYIDPTGDDSTGDGSSGSPWATVQHALDQIPKNLGSFTATVLLNDGSYTESFSITSFHSGIITISSTSGNRTLVSIVGNITIQNCTALIQVINLSIYESSNIAINIFDSTSISVGNLRLTGATYGINMAGNGCLTVANVIDYPSVTPSPTGIYANTGTVCIANDVNFGTVQTSIQWAVVVGTNKFLLTPSTAPTTDYQVPNKKYVDDKFNNAGTVTKVSVTTANGVSGTVATDTTTPAITLVLGAITPTSVNGLVVSTGILVADIILGYNTYVTKGASPQRNIVIGNYCVDESTINGRNNVVIGHYSSRALRNGWYNTIVGDGSADSLLDGGYNVVVGREALKSNVSGTGNIAIGNLAGAYETGSDILIIDSQGRTDTASEKVGAILYGVMHDIPAGQTLTTNSKFTATYGIEAGQLGAPVATLHGNQSMRIGNLIYGYGTFYASQNTSGGSTYYAGNAAETDLTTNNFCPHIFYGKGISTASPCFWTYLGMCKSGAEVNAVQGCLGVNSAETGVRIGSGVSLNTNLQIYNWWSIGIHDPTFDNYGGMQMRCFKYTGNGSDNRAMTGLGFTPDTVIIFGAGAQYPHFRNRLHAKAAGADAGDLSSYLSNPSADIANCIQSMDADGFTIGTNAVVNTNAVVYYGVAFASSASAKTRVCLTDYQGQGGDGFHLDLPFSPTFAMTIPAGALSPIIWTDVMTAGESKPTDAATANATTGILGTSWRGLKIGSHVGCNTANTKVVVIAIQGLLSRTAPAGTSVFA
jgi:hypothetical protein